jgi:indolepyruvate ferredoxin oxidoreductase, alpha subunit
MKRLLSGNEAVAQGAWEAGASVASSYPGTPSTEITETFARFPDVYAEWAPNEKVALDAAIGAAYAGQRAFSTMKHVGLNVAADSFFYVSSTGIEAGLVIISADDPSMHSSQNEQDSRQFAKFARMPCLDPSNSQEAKDFTIAAFELSEQFDTPVMLHMTTRICHTSAPVEINPERYQTPKPGKYPRNIPKYVMVPNNARVKHIAVEQRLRDLSVFAETYALNRIEMRSAELGIITSGIAYQYAREVFPDASILKLGMTFPIPGRMIQDFAGKVEKLIVLEELDPFIEDQVRLMGIEIYSGINENVKINNPNFKSIFPITNELDMNVVRSSAAEAGLLPASAIPETPPVEMELPMRPPVLCPGCPHRSTFYILHKLKLPVNGDIGCYTLGVMPPLHTMHTCGCMGAGIGVAHGAAIAGDEERHVAVIGDSTFFHTGIPALINVAYNQSNVITIIMDNRITGMTGHQNNPGTGLTLQEKETMEIDLEALVRVLGIDDVVTVEAFDVKAIEDTLKAWRNEDGPKVLITKEPCALLPGARKRWMPLIINAEKCIGCDICLRTGCPALLKSDQVHHKNGRNLTKIDPLLCTGCEICAQVCPQDAILFRNQIKDINEQSAEVAS